MYLYNIIFALFLMDYQISAMQDYSFGNDYLTDRYEFIQNLFTEHKISARETESNVEFHETKSIPLSDKYKSASTFKLFNQTHLLLDNELFDVQQEDDKFTLTAIALFEDFSEEKIQFVKSTNYDGIGLIFIAFRSGAYKIYAYENSTLTAQKVLIQHKQSPNKLTDAKFFINKGFLYLAVATMSGHSKAPFIIYKWEKAYFDEVSKEFIEGAIALTSFTSADSEIIIVLRNLRNSYVYEFAVNVGLTKIQIIDTVNPKLITAFKDDVNNKQFVIILEGSNKNYLFYWNGVELQLYQIFSTDHDVLNVAINYINNKPVIVMANLQFVDIYGLRSRNVYRLDSLSFSQTFTEIFEIQFTHFQNKDFIIVLGLIDNYLSGTITPFVIKEIEIVGQIKENNELLECMEELENQVDNSQAEMVKMTEGRKHIIKINEPFEVEERDDILGGASSTIINSRSVPTKFEEDLFQVEEILGTLETKASNLEQHIGEILNSNNTVVNGKLIIQGGLNAENLTSQSIHIKKLNGINWTPEQWLSYSTEQRITGAVFVKNLIIYKIHLPTKNNMILNELLLLNGDQKMSGNIKITSLKASSVVTNGINGVALNDVYLRSVPMKISGRKTFTNVDVDNVKVELLNGQNASDAIRLFADPKTFQYIFQPNTKIQNLNVKEINNIAWDSFVASLFQTDASMPQHIHGNLTMRSFKTNNLHAEFINGLDVKNLLTTSTDQIITSQMKFNNVNVKNIVSSNINGLDFGVDVATFAENIDTIITGPVTIKSIEIKNLIVNRSVSELNKQNHIVGTNESDLLQIYNNTVKINGNLHLENVHLLHSAKLFINGNEFNQENFNEYWLKTTNQEIPVRFHAQGGISTPHLHTQLLNNVSVQDYMVNNFDDKSPTSYVFENVTVAGNIIINPERNHQPDLEKLERDSVKLNGVHVIKGVKIFNGNVTVDNLKTDFINSLTTASFLNKLRPDNFGSKVFETLIVKNSVNITNLLCANINGINLDTLSNDTMYIDGNYQINNMDFSNVTADHLSTTSLNKRLFKQYVIDLDEIYLMKVLNKLQIKNNASIDNANDVVQINDIKLAELLERVGDVNSNEAIRGNITFDGKVHVKNLLVSNINGINFTDLLPRLYYRDWMQNVTARHTFKILAAPHILTSQINEVKLVNLIDVKKSQPQLLEARNGLILKNARFGKSLRSDFGECSIDNMISSITTIPMRYWESVEVEENVTLWDEHANLSVLLRTAVLSNKDNVINAPVILNHVYAENVNAEMNINNVNLTSIVEDALLHDEPNQIVTGFKTFDTISADNVEIDGVANIPIINSIKMSALNDSILDKKDVNNVLIKGRKHFLGGIEANLLRSNMIAGARSENLVSLNNLEAIPSCVFNRIAIKNNLSVDYINNQNFYEFINDRLLLNSDEDQIVSGIYYFNDVQLNGETTMSAINDVILDDVVFDERGLDITSVKRFLKPVEIIGDIMVKDINGYNIADICTKSIMLDKQANVTGNIHFKDVSQITGNVYAKNINGMSINSIHEMLESPNAKIRADIIRDTINNIKDVMNINFDMIKRLPDEFMYLERADKLQLDFDNVIDAQVVSSKDGLMIHIYSEANGHKCGLPASCFCPNQNTIQITEKYALNFIENKFAQRVFSYQSDEISIHVITNSKTSNNYCRNNATILHEFTTITWTKFSNKSETFVYAEKLDGYISDVKFFTLDGFIYAIVGRFYDPAINSHNVDCLVLRFSKELDKVEHVQKLNANGASVIHVFHTAQGINLIIGNKPDLYYYYNLITVDVYQFNPNTRMFDLLRKIPTSGCVSITSVVLGYESLIILATVKSPVQIFKYHPHYNNYYLYQSLTFSNSIINLSTFYIGGTGIGDAYLAVVGDKGHFYIFSYKYLIGWKLASEGDIAGLRGFAPFTLQKVHHLFALSTKTTSLLTIVKHGRNSKNN